MGIIWTGLRALPALVWALIVWAYTTGPDQVGSKFAQWAHWFGFSNLPHTLTDKATDGVVLTVLTMALVIYVIAVWVCPLAPRPALPSLVSVTAIANYLEKESAWGRGQLSFLNVIEFVHDAVPSEMTRAASDGDLTFEGARPNSANSESIDRIYWRSFQFDPDRIWDARNDFFTRDYGHHPAGGYHMRHGAASREAVLKTWPPATLCQRLRPILWVSTKKAWWRMTSVPRSRG
jgi:hypothetical protein